MKKLPNILTAIRILFVPIIALLVIIPAKNTNIFAFTLYFIACITDWLDGYIARKFSAASPLGGLLDSIADKLLVVTLLIALSACGLIEGTAIFAAGIIILREVIIPALRQFLGDYDINIPPSWVGKIKTTVQMIALGLIMIVPFKHSGDMMWSIAALGIPLLWFAALLTIWSAADYFYRGIKQFLDLQR